MVELVKRFRICFGDFGLEFREFVDSLVTGSMGKKGLRMIFS